MNNITTNRRIQLAALWVSACLCYLYGDYFELYTPDKVESLISGENVLNTPLALFIASVIMLIPPLMVVGSLMLTFKLAKVLNLIFGVLFTLMMLFIAINSLTPWYSFYVLLALVESFLTGLIIWKASHWSIED